MKTTIISVCVVVALLTGGGYLYKGAVERESALRTQLNTLSEAQKQAEKRRKSDRKVLVATQAKIALQGRKLAQTEAALSEALQRNKSWSDTDVPDDVQKALYGASDGLGGPSAGERVHEQSADRNGVRQGAP